MTVAPVAELEPLTQQEFTAAMAALGPFERCPHLAVAVSGGADSVALCLLANDWARERGGRVTALTVDHRLRPASEREAEQVRRWMHTLGIEHCTLRWLGLKPSSGIQAAARSARYALLCSWCRDAGVLHLLLGHHLQDQAETVLMRMMRGSGVAGLSAMAPIAERPEVRLLRPVLGFPPDRLKAVLTARQQDWIDDLSNRDDAFARTKVRTLLPLLAASGLDAAALAAIAGSAGRARAAIAHLACGLLARGCRLHPAGFCCIVPGAWTVAPTEVALRALACMIAAIGGRSYEPGMDQVESLYSKLTNGTQPAPASTLGGCLVLPKSSEILVCREGRGLPAPMTIDLGERVIWDNRFLIQFCADERHESGRFRLRALGRSGWQQVVCVQPSLRHHPIPFPARLSLPALADNERVVAVPHLGYCPRNKELPTLNFAGVFWRPPKPLMGAGSFVVWRH